MAGSLDDNPPNLLGGTEHTFGADDYQYLILSRDKGLAMASIWLSKQATMTRTEIADQLRRLADFVESQQ
jgi:hypothetical protein